jgi:DNA replication protein DnaC
VITDLATCLFVEKKEHVLIPAWVGKTHAAQALSHEACRRGYSALFMKAEKMFRHLFASQADQSRERQITKYLHPDLLIINDFGLTALSLLQVEDFYELVTQRHLRSSIVITSKQPPQGWVALFPDPVLANSVLDRLSYRAHHIMVDEGKSYSRKEEAPKLRH